MARFLLGDELGNIKVLRCSPHSNDSKTTVSTIHHREPLEGVNRGVQQIASSAPIDNKNSALVCLLCLNKHGES